MNNDTQKANAPSSARRRLVRGAFSAPAVLTLYSGSALATASLTCRTKAIADPLAAGATAPIPTQGNWLRVQAYSKTYNLVTKYFISGNDVSNLANMLGSGGSYLTTTQWQLITGTPTIKEASTFTTLPQAVSGQYVAVKVNSVGRVVGYSDMNVANSAMMSMGCWSSIIV